MHALVFDGALHYVSDYPDPRPTAQEAVVRVRLAGICGTDLELTRGYKGGFRGVLGHEFVGEVIECADASWLGRRVCADINVACGHCAMCGMGIPSQCQQRTVLGILGHDGAFAERISVPIRNLHTVPDGVPDDSAVFVEPLAAAFQILEQVPLSPGDRAVVLGDGRLGNLCAQVLATTDADLVVIGKHPEKLRLLRDRDIATRTITDALPQNADIVVEATGSPSGLAMATDMVRPRGTLVLKTTVARAAAIDWSPIVVKEITVIGSRCGPFERAIYALQNGRVDVKPLIEGRFPLSDGIAAINRAGERGVLKIVLDTSA